MDWAPSQAVPGDGWGNYPEGGEEGCTRRPCHGHALGWEQGDSMCLLLLVPPRLRWAPASPLQTTAAEGDSQPSPGTAPRPRFTQDCPHGEEPRTGSLGEDRRKIIRETRPASSLILPSCRVRPPWVNCAG